VIVRILGEGQWTLDEGRVSDLNELDDAVDAAVSAGDQGRLTAALAELLNEVRVVGTPVPDAELLDSDLILPSADATLEEVRELLDPAGEGLIPG
jgi:hypothetical protein